MGAEDLAAGPADRVDPVTVSSLVPVIIQLLRGHEHPDCRHIPNALALYPRMRPATLQRDYSDAIAQRILVEPNHPFVTKVREAWLEEHPELAGYLEGTQPSDETLSLVSQSASPGELRTRLLDVLGTLWLARGQDVRTDATFQLLRAL